MEIKNKHLIIFGIAFCFLVGFFASSVFFKPKSELDKLIEKEMEENKKKEVEALKALKIPKEDLEKYNGYKKLTKENAETDVQKWYVNAGGEELVTKFYKFFLDGEQNEFAELSIRDFGCNLRKKVGNVEFFEKKDKVGYFDNWDKKRNFESYLEVEKKYDEILGKKQKYIFDGYYEEERKDTPKSFWPTIKVDQLNAGGEEINETSEWALFRVSWNGWIDYQKAFVFKYEEDTGLWCWDDYLVYK